MADLSSQWQLDVGPPFELSYGYVAPARRADGTQVVLKIAFPHQEARGESVALRLYNGDGACRLLEADEPRFAILLERLVPGQTLVSLAEADDEAATRVGAAMMAKLWRPVPGDVELKPISEWFEDAFARHRGEYGGAGPFPPRLFEKAERLAGELLASAPADLVLHGDLHHFNILSAERAPWLVIDPKGMRGDPGYEAGPFLLNPWGRNPGMTRAALQRRLAIFAEDLNYDRGRLRDWGIAHAVLSACWAAENGGTSWPSAIRVAEML